MNLVNAELEHGSDRVRISLSVRDWVAIVGIAVSPAIAFSAWAVSIDRRVAVSEGLDAIRDRRLEQVEVNGEELARTVERVIQLQRTSDEIKAEVRALRTVIDKQFGSARVPKTREDET